MDKPVDLKKFKQSRLRKRAQADTLCRRGFHKWQFDEKKQFDVKQGKLVSIKRCTRCQITRSVVS
ncbi:MAG: hypothetical protein RIC89_19040 [Pseudomonadales bacterium]